MSHLTVISLLLVTLPFSAGQVSTSSGELVGRTENVGDGQVVQYLGVPYAEPPVGQLRFQQPVWKTNVGSIDANTYKPACPQHPSTAPVIIVTSPQREDCLYLNLFVPQSGTTNMAVMVFIHGGGFARGTGDNYFLDPSLIAQQGDVIVVTINYRLGVLGFLSTDDINARGNYGLWDQVMALTWVKQNIGKFGGDSEKTTIFGQSAGATSAEILSVSPIVTGLFQRMIIHSGYAMSGYLIQEDPKQNAQDLAVYLGCQPGPPGAIVQCLKSKTVAEILDAQSNVGGPWMPVVDGMMLPKPPMELAEYSRSFDMIIGMCQDEGRIYLPGFIRSLTGDTSPNPIESGINQDTYDALVDFFTEPFDNSGKLAGLYKNFHGNPDDPIGRVRSASALKLDVKFLMSTVHHARMHAEGESPRKHMYDIVDDEYGKMTTYMYRFDPYNLFPQSLDTTWADKATHVDDLWYIFGNVQTPAVHNLSTGPSDTVLSKQMITYWTNFAKTGNPNSDFGGLSTYWPEFTLVDEAYIILDRDMDGDSTGTRIFNDRVEFWTEHVAIFGPIAPEVTTSGTVRVLIPIAAILICLFTSMHLV